jgi:hypothetical protein
MGILDTALSTAGAGARLAWRAPAHVVGGILGLRGGSSRPPKDLGDADLTNKVRTVLFRDLSGEEKGDVDVNVVDGAVYLRGVARTPEQINALEDRARAIPEVVAVHNLLHLPGTPAPTRTDTPAAQRKTRRSSATPAKPRTEPRRMNADKTAEKGERPPKAAAERGAGRAPAPLGSEGEPEARFERAPGEPAAAPPSGSLDG